MRILISIFLLSCVASCQAQTPEAQVLAAYSQLEKAVRTGDSANTFVGLWTREKQPEAQKMRALMPPQPNVHYTSSKIYVLGNEAVLLGQYSEDGFLNLRYVIEDGRWKIKDFASSDKAYPGASVYAMLPPPGGAFIRAGEPWQNIAPALDKANAAKQGWQLRSTFDESYLYIRIESVAEMASPGTPAEKPPMGWPVMKLEVPGSGEFVLHSTANIGDRATFDQNGHANSHHQFVSYWLMLEESNHMIFQTFADSNSDPLVRAGGHALEVRVPLRTMRVGATPPAKIVIGDAQWPKSAVFTTEAHPYK